VQVAAVAGSFTVEFLARYYAEHGLPLDAPTELAAPLEEKDPAIIARNAKRLEPKSATKKAPAAKSTRQKRAAKA
jgi:hypothetical protein